MLNNSYTQEQMIAEVNELLEFIYRKTRQEEPSDFDRLLYQLGSEYLRLISQKNEGCFKTSSLLNLPIGTRFFVTNGYWVGRVVLLDGVKHIYVEATRRVLRLTHEYAKSITAYIISEQKRRC